MKTKKITNFILIALIGISLFSCASDDNANSTDDQNNDNSTDSILVQFTPDQADWETLNNKPIDSGSNSAHDPDGVTWISDQTWDDAKWDGTIYDPTKMTKAEFHQALFPSGDILRGIREVFYKENPFKDVKNPTKAEVDEWHRISINHLRALVGYTSEDRKVKKDHCMFARSLWGQERRFTTMWDTKYPDPVNGNDNADTAYGPCQGGTNSHCGASFIPNATDQIPYLPLDYDTCGTPGGAEGVVNAPKSNIVWSLKWIRGISNFVGTEGFWGGHVGPFFHREKFGFSFWDDDINDNNSNATLRAKWTGNTMDNLYEKP